MANHDGDGAGPPRRPPWVTTLIAACVVVGVGLVVALVALFVGPSQEAPAPEPTPGAGGGPAPSSAAGEAYRLSDPLPLATPPVWHATPSAEYRLTAAPDELRYVSDSGCRLSFRVGPLRPAVSPSPGRTTPLAPSASASPSPDPETAATRAALADAIEAERAGSSSLAVTAQGFAVVTTLGSPSGPLVDMAGAALRVGHADGTLTSVRVAVRAVPSAQSAAAMVAECPQPEQAATAMNHASVHSYLADR
jgi:hypothetical protein